MIHLIYVSSATEEVTEDGLLHLLERARIRNLKKNVTGMLLYVGGNFFQVLEGEESAVDEIYRAIVYDDRNTGNIVIVRDAINERDFPNWSMGFKHLTLQDKKNIKGYTDFLDKRMTPDELASLDMTVELLYQFKEDNL